jgi:hypothetical protein
MTVGRSAWLGALAIGLFAASSATAGVIFTQPVDPLLEGYIEHDLGIDELVTQGFDPETVRRVATLVDRNEYKRRQAPPGVRISRRAFGRDRRYPITSGFLDAQLKKPAAD